MRGESQRLVLGSAFMSAGTQQVGVQPELDGRRLQPIVAEGKRELPRKGSKKFDSVTREARAMRAAGKPMAADGGPPQVRSMKYEGRSAVDCAGLLLQPGP